MQLFFLIGKIINIYFPSISNGHFFLKFRRHISECSILTMNPILAANLAVEGKIHSQ